MAKIIKNVTVTWTWSGDIYALKGFNLMVLSSGQNPTDGTIQVLASANQVPAESRSYSFNNLTLDTAVTYVPWVQAFYENDDSDWVSSTGFAVSDDGQNTLTTRVEAEGYAATALDEARKLVPAIVGTQTATTGSWVGVAPFATLTDGQQVNYWLPYAGSGNATLNLTLSGGGTTGAIACYYGGTTRLTTHYGAGSSILLTYRVNASISGTLYTGWWAQPSFYSDTYDRTRYYQSMKATEAITAGQLMMSDDLGYKKILNSRTYDVTKPILWAGSNISANGTSNNNYTIYPGVSLTSTIAGISFTSTKVVYIRGTLAGTNFTTNATAASVFTDTPTDDGVSTYIALGQLYSTTNILLYAEHPLFKFSEGVFKSFAQIAAEAQATADSKSKTFPSGTNPTNYKIGDLWQDGQQVKVANAASAIYNSSHWVLAGDVTSENTAKDTTMVNGTAASDIATGAANGTTANNAVTANSATWGRASNINSDGTFNTSKLNGTLSDTQIASANAWNNAKTLVNDITTDGTLTPFEKQTLKLEYDAILKEKIEAVTLATNYMVTSQSYYTNYIAAYDALYAGMNTMMTTNIASNSTVTRSIMQGWFTNYYEKAAIFQRNINEAARTIASGAATSAATANELAKAMTSGKLLYKDPVFLYGNNSVSVYNNSANSNVVHTRITKPADAPTNSTHLIEIKNIGAASPGIGGFVQNLTARANAKFVIRYIAKIPIGYTITTASNSMGDGYTDSFLTATAGTGKYEEYIRVVQCGPTGSFSSGGHVYLNGAAGTVSVPVVWYLARIDTYDVTGYESFASHINDDPDTQRIEGKKMHFTNEVLMDNAWIDNLVANSIVTSKIQATTIDASKITAGTLSADRIAASSLSGDKIIANTIDVTRLKIGSGAQGGYINNPRFSAWSEAYPDGTSQWSGGGISKVTVDNVSMAQFAPAAGAQHGMQLGSSYFASGIDLDGMQYFTLECRFRLTVGTNPSGAAFLVDIYRQDNSTERMQLNMSEAGSSLTTNVWYVARKVFKLADANVAKTFKNVSGYLLANWSGSGDAAKTIQFASVNMFQASAQEFLAQSWTNGGTTSINGGFIATGTLSADKITTGALNASLITTGNLDAARITAGTINAGNGKSTINMSTGAFSLGSGKIAFDGTTLSLNVDSLKISNSSVATQTYASSAAETAKTEALTAAANDAATKASNALTSAQSYADTKVGEIQIGGRNLARGTSSDYSTPYTSFSGVTNTCPTLATVYTTGLSAGDTMSIKLLYEYTNIVPASGQTARIWIQGKGNITGSSSGLFPSPPQKTISGSGTHILETSVVLTADHVSNGFWSTNIRHDYVQTGSVRWKMFKVEKGNKATDWTPAPEDVTLEIEQKADTSAVANAINGVASSAAGAQATANAKLDKSAYDNFIKEYGEYKTALAADQSAAAGNLQAAQTAVASIQKEMGDMKESWIFNNGTKIEATGNGMLISDGNPSGMNMLLSQNRLSFFDGGVEVAYIADKTMKINHGIFVTSARIGSHLISTSPTNSDITIVSFVGED